MMNRDEVYRKYYSTVNMSYLELLRWSRNPCSRLASVDRSPITRNLRLLSTPRTQWSPSHVRDANRTISFVSRMRGVKSGKIVGCGLSRRDIALLNWAYDPRKGGKR